MSDELKRDMAPAYLEATRAPQPPCAQASKTPARSSELVAPAADTLTSPSPRWFDAQDPSAIAPPPRRSYGVLPLAFVALLLVSFGQTLVMRAVLPVALTIAALVVFGRSRRAQEPAARAHKRGLRLEPARLVFYATEPAQSQTLLCIGEPFGVTLLSTSQRDRAIALLTSPTGTFCIGSTFDGSARRVHAPLFDAAFTVTSDETGLEAIAPDGEPILLAPPEFASLLGALTSVEPSCFDRLVLSDARGAPLLLDGRELRTGDRAIDLAAPLEWRGIVFQEGFGSAIAIYQGTWIRQGATEIVLVSLLPSIASAGAMGMTEGSPLATLDRGVLRDLRLMQAVPAEPPPAEQRIAIDRLFMLPVRFALDKAPRPPKHSPGRAQRQ